jgi:hypothetical protein
VVNERDSIAFRLGQPLPDPFQQLDQVFQFRLREMAEQLSVQGD